MIDKPSLRLRGGDGRDLRKSECICAEARINNDPRYTEQGKKIARRRNRCPAKTL